MQILTYASMNQTSVDSMKFSAIRLPRCLLTEKQRTERFRQNRQRVINRRENECKRNLVKEFNIYARRLARILRHSNGSLKIPHYTDAASVHLESMPFERLHRLKFHIIPNDDPNRVMGVSGFELSTDLYNGKPFVSESKYYGIPLVEEKYSHKNGAVLSTVKNSHDTVFNVDGQDEEFNSSPLKQMMQVALDTTKELITKIRYQLRQKTGRSGNTNALSQSTSS